MHYRLIKYSHGENYIEYRNWKVRVAPEIVLSEEERIELAKLAG